MADSDCADRVRREFVLPDPDSCVGLAMAIARYLQLGDVLALDGPLGAGKTTFVRALVAALGGEVDLVSSPTYTLMNIYHTQPTVIHIDAYRLSGGDELEGLGMAELLDDGIACIEWAERIEDLDDHCRRCWRLAFEHRSTGRGVRIYPADPTFAWEGAA